MTRGTRDLAIVGLGCRFPGARDPQAFWRLLDEGRDAIREIGRVRPELAPTRDGEGEPPRWAGLIDDIDLFDAGFFGIAPREADAMDPQQRLLLEVAWEALEAAGETREGLAGSATGVFVGISTFDYSRIQPAGTAQAGLYAGTGNALSIAANRLSYVLDLRGPSVAVDTACSSSLVALHLARQSLLSGECERALVGGVNLLLAPELMSAFAAAHMLAPDGHCKTFDAEADGYVRGEGCGVIVLKPLDAAREAGDPVLAVLRGSAVNQDGRSNGLTAPNGPAQIGVVRAALAAAGEEPAALGYVEAHGTGTRLGDPIEALALAEALEGRPAEAPLAVGSVKTNIGHLEAAAGIAGVIKTVLALRHGRLPASLNFRTPNPEIPFADLGLAVLAEPAPWPTEARLAGVSSFGFGGANAHVLLAPAPAEADDRPPVAPEARLLALSTAEPAALGEAARRMAERLNALGDDARAFADLCWTAAFRRTHHDERLAVVAHDAAEAARLLAAAAAGEETDGTAGRVFSGRRPARPKRGTVGADRPLAEIAAAYVAGRRIAWADLFPTDSRLVPLPAYPWQRRRHWFAEAPAASVAPEPAAAPAPIYRRAWEPIDRLPAPGLAERLSQAAEALRDPAREAKVWELEAALDRLCAGFARRAVAAVGPDDVAEAHRRLYARLCAMAEDAAAAENPESLAAELQARYPDHRAGVALVAECGGALPEILAGARDPLEILFPGGSGARLAALYADSAVTRAANGLAAEAAGHLADTLPDGRTLRVLELGAGTGGTTEGLLARLGDGRARYLFTDVAPPLLAQAAQRYAAHAWLETATLDIEREPSGQGVAPGAWDLVVAANVLHATRDLGETLAHVRQCLAPGGRLVLLEQTAPRRWLDLVFGLTEGWWRFEDLERRPDYPLLDAEGWRQALTEAGLALDAVEACDGSGAQTVLVARRPEAVAPAGRWLVVADRGGAPACLEGELDAELLAPGPVPEDTRQAVSAALEKKTFAGLLCLAPLDGGAEGLQRTLAALRAVAAAPQALPVALVTRGSQAVAPGDAGPDPWQAAAWGLARSFAIERPDCAGWLVDLDDAPLSVVPPLLALEGERQLAVRGGRVHALRLEPLALAAGPEAPVSAEGRYLVYGGTGALGGEIARWLADRGARHLVLASRGPASETALAPLRARGIAVEAVESDLADTGGVAALVARLAEADPPLKGVVHAAGTFENAPIADLDWERCAPLLDAKLHGAEALLAATAGQPLDFCVFLSSVAATLGLPRAGNYAAANAALEAAVTMARAAGQPAMALACGPVAGLGMAERAEAARWEAAGVRGIAPARLRATLDAAVGGGEACPLALEAKWDKLAEVVAFRDAPAWIAPARPRRQAAGQVAEEAELRARLDAAFPAERPAVALDFVRRQVAAVLALPPDRLPDPDRGLQEIGLDSLSGLELRDRLQRAVGLPLPATLALEHPTPNALATAVLARLEEAPRASDRAAQPAAPRKMPQREVDARENPAQAMPERDGSGPEPIAIVGLSCRFPGGQTPEAFWELLAEGRDAIGPIPADRWDAARFNGGAGPGRSRAARGAFLDDVKGFDAAFFHLSGREADALDPQQRLLLEVAWEALERSGLSPQALRGTRTGVFVGITSHDYADRQIAQGRPEAIDAYFGSGNTACFAAGRLSYLLGLEGPSLAIDTACSASLVALHQACLSLRSGETERALVGGVHLMLSPGGFLYNDITGALSPDGMSRTFDAGANGFGRGEGCAVLVLRRLSDALASGEKIHAVVRGSAVNQDGASGGLTVPSGAAQQAVVRAALADSGLSPDDIDYLEAHGTGTVLGDPVELKAAGAVFAGRPSDRPLLVGSVKTNVGHLEAAAGLAGVVKTVLAMDRGVVPPHLHLETPNPHVPWGELPIRVPTAAEPWPGANRPRRAGISAFSLMGTNAHVVLEQAPAVRAAEAPPAERSHHPFVLSARSPAALRALAAACAEAVDDREPLGDRCATNNAGRAQHAHRLAATVATPAELRTLLAAVGAGEDPAAVAFGRAGSAPTPVAFLFTGQGAVGPDMGRSLFESAPAFAAELQRCADILAPHLDVPLLDLLYGAESARLSRTRYAQPALVAVEWSLARLWRSWGVEPAAVLGHSLGEYVAAAVAGAIEPERLLPLVAERGRIMDALPEGAMLAAAADEATVAAAIEGLEEAVSIAAVNAPGETVVAGEEPTVAQVAARLDARGVRSQRLAVSHAFHAPSMEAAMAELAALAASVEWSPARLPWARNLDGRLLERGAVPPPEDWACHARQPVRFADGLKSLAGLEVAHFLEIGPRPVLSALGPASLPDARFLPALRPGRPDWQATLESLAALWIEGVPVDWPALEAPYDRRRLWQPGYPFERRPHWVEEPTMSESPQPRATAVPAEPGPVASAPGPGALEAMVALVAKTLGSDPATVDPDAPLLELGADSIVLVEIGHAVKARYGVTLSAKQFFEELTSVRALAAFVAAAAPEPSPAASPVAPTAAAPGGEGPSGASEDLAGLFARQLDLVQEVIQGQLQALRAHGLPAAAPQALAAPAAGAASAAPRPPVPPSRALGPYRPPARRGERPAEDPRRRAHLEALVARFTARTPTSKRLAEAARPRLADSRASAGFRPSVKEMLYPLVAERAEGARLWDVDGNAYVDVSMDFGVNLFGHRAPFLVEAMQEAIGRGLAMAPRARDAAAAADLVCELTGMDRVVFCQSGSESVMTAVRLARLATGRDGIALFRNSYHGHTDGLLGVGGSGDFDAEPVAPGIPAGMVGDLLPLDYTDPESFDVLRRHAGRLAAVLVEPVQSRALDLEPGDYLRALRAVTRELGLLLIFDEMITGFRLHPGGAQAHFGVEADLATYGKALGGGVEVAAVAGRGRLLDGIDGGAWRYGDESYPEADTTFFAGTFNANPLAMATTRAALEEMKGRGPALQENLNALTDRFARDLNDWLGAEGVPLKVANRGSLFRFVHRGNLDLLFYHLLEKGVFVWEGRNCFLSDAHGEAEVAFVAQAVRESVEALREGGYLEADGGNRAAEPSAPSPTGGTTVLPLTAAQQQLWLLAQTGAEGSLAYTESLAVEIEGRLEVAALKAALDRLAARHEALRTAIDPDGRTQKTLESVPLKVEEAEGTDREAWLAEVLARPFDLAEAPLVRVGLLREGAGRHVLALAAHHIVVDGWSLGLLVADLCACYRAEVEGAPPPPLPQAQLGDLVRHQERALAGARRAELERWWRETLTPLPEPLDLPFDRRPDAAGPRGGRHRFALDAEVRGRLDALGRSAGATPFASLLAAVTAFLHRLTGREALLVGCPVLGRGEDPALTEAVGYATHLVVVPSRVEPGLSFHDHLRRSRSALVEALDRQDYPYAELLRLLGLAWSAERPPLLDVTFNLDRPQLDPSLPGATARLLPTSQQAPKFPLSLNALQIGGELLVDLDYDAGLFTEAAVARLAEQLQVWIAALVAQPEEPLEALTPVGPAERALLLQAWNDTATAWPDDAGLVHQAIAAQAARTPEAPALTFAGRTLTYERLLAESGVLAARLVELGVGPETTVACLFDRSFEMLVGLLATMRAGAAYMPVALDEAPARLAGALADAEPPVALTRAGLAAAPALRAALAEGRPLLEIGPIDPDAPVPETGALPALPRAAADQPAYLLFTSGSTGKPKGVVSLHRGLRNRLLWMQRAFPIGPGKTVLQKTPYTFDVSVWELFWPLAQGARLVVAEPEVHRDPLALARLVQGEGVTHCHFVPSMLSVFLDQPEAAACTALERVVCSGEALPRDLVERFHALGLPAELHNLYGPTEAAIDVTHWPCAEAPEAAVVPIGRPIANTLVRVLDERGALCPVGATGEIYLGGVQLARGYLKRPDLTAKAFVDDPFAPGEKLYRTGDLGRWRADGALVYLGRRDGQLKLRGQRIELGEIESALRAHPAVRDAAAGPVGRDPVSQRLAAWVVPAQADPAARGDAAAALPGGPDIAVLNRAETDFMVREHFEERTYFRHGIGLPEDAVVLDVGANVGVFALSVAASLPAARVHAFEPVPAVHALLARNAGCAPGRIVPHAWALGDADGETAFTWYPHVSILSGSGADPGEEAAVVRAFVSQAGGAGGEADGEGVDPALLDELLADRLACEELRVPVRRLSGVLAELDLPRVDLLKIDVEKAEWAVLEGIEAADWPKVRQVVVEVHDVDGRLARVRAKLEAEGFAVAVEQDAWLAGTAIVCLYARRPEDPLPPVPAPRPETLAASVPVEGAAPLRPALADELRAFLAGRLPPHMVPDLFLDLPALPLSAHGKIDRKALPQPASARPAPPAPSAPQSDLQRRLLGLWRELLGPVDVGIHDDFFRLGGHSLLAARLVGSVRERFAVELTIKDFLDRPTLAAMSAAVERAQATGARVRASVAQPEAGGAQPGAAPAPIARADRNRRRLDRSALGLETRATGSAGTAADATADEGAAE